MDIKQHIIKNNDIFYKRLWVSYRIYTNMNLFDKNKQ